MRFRDRLARFFWGRNGFDALANTVMVASLVVMVISGFIPIPIFGLFLYMFQDCSFHLFFSISHSLCLPLI